MYDNSIKEELKERLEEYVLMVTNPLPKSGKHHYICPLCKSGTGNNGKFTAAFVVKGKVWTCYACGENGDIFTLHALLNNLDLKSDFPRIIKEVAEKLGENIDEDKTKKKESEKEEVKSNEMAKKIDYYASKMPGSLAEKYLLSRGLSKEIISEFNIGFNPESQRVVIPYPGIEYKTERTIKADEEKKYLYPKGESLPLFKINESNSNFYFITEGQIDAISLYQAGARNVIALGGGRYHLLDDIKIEAAVIVADRDLESSRKSKDGLTPGERTANNIAECLRKKNAKSIIVFPPENYKDSNDLLKSDQKKLRELVNQWSNDLKAAPDLISEKKEEIDEFKTVNISEYLIDKVFEEDIKYFLKYKNRKTGFENIDRYMTLYPGVCCLGGASSLGKTTFAINVVDNLLNRGETVLYFSLEQLSIELVTKSLAREMYRIDPLSPIDNIGIKNGEKTSALGEAKLRYAQTAERYQIIEGDFHFTAKKIVDCVEEYIEKKGVKPIVVIDYLQLIAPPEGFKGTLRESTDENLKAIKDMSKRNELFVLLISSFNRASYKEPVSMESFKESGMIEYTCDYILGLQLSILEDPEFFAKKGPNGGERDTNNYAKEKKLFKAINEDPKEVELVGLKNRNGKQRFKCFFKYNMKYDTFTPDMNSKHDPEITLSKFKNNNDDLEFEDL